MSISVPEAGGEIYLVNKPYRWTSFDVVKKIQNVLAAQLQKQTGHKSRVKIGHAGTLDPLATGLLVLCTGKMTKKIPEIQDADKEYTGIITLGATRPSYDLETEINQTFETGHINEVLVAEAAQHFIGNILQVPPSHSAIKVEGTRAYKIARKGEDLKLSPRPITISSFEITRFSPPEVHFRVVCSKGTYIRSLAHDFGRYLNSGAFLSELCRTRIGEYRLENAVDMSSFIDMS